MTGKETAENRAEEAVLFADNDYPIYKRRQPFIDNLNRKKKSGKYDPSKAVKLWMYYADEISKAYFKQFGRGDWGDGTGTHAFSTGVRKLIATHYANMYDAGEME